MQGSDQERKLHVFVILHEIAKKCKPKSNPNRNPNPNPQTNPKPITN